MREDDRSTSETLRFEEGSVASTSQPFGIAGELEQLSGGFAILEAALAGLSSSLHGLDVQDTGPEDVVATFAEAMERLERILENVGSQAADAATVMRRFARDQPVGAFHEDGGDAR